MLETGVTVKEAELEQRVEALEETVGEIMTILASVTKRSKQGDLWVTDMIRGKGDGYGG